MHLNYVKEAEERSASGEITLCDYFTHLFDSERFSPGTFWCVCRTLRVHILAVYRVNVRNYVSLKDLLKTFTQDHVKKKPDVFSYLEI